MSFARWHIDLLALVAGVIGPLAFAPFGWFWLAPLSIAALFFLLRFGSDRRAFFRAWLFGVGFFGLGVSWVAESFQYNHIAWPVAIGLTIAFVFFLSLFIAFAMWAARRLVDVRSTWALCTAVPALWIAAEWSRGEFLTGFTWLQLGYAQIDGPLAGFAPIVGSLGLSALVAVSAGLLVGLPGMGRRRWVGVVALVCIWAGGAGLRVVDWTEPAGDALSVALVQGNVSQDQKWRPENRIPTIRGYVQHTRAHWDADLVIWPETAVPAFYREAKGMLEELGREAAETNTELLVGLPVAGADGRPRNAMVHVGADPQFYHKTHLVPFGEYLPLEALLRPLAKAVGIPVPAFTPGPMDQPLFVVNGVPAAMMICYEVTFGDEVAAHLPAAQLLLNVSNDAWFGDSLAPHQHLQMARMRALETGRFLARATNTGITALINSRGRITVRSKQFEQTVVTGSLTPMGGATPYVRVKDWPVLAMAALCILGVWWRRRGLARNPSAPDR